MEANKINWTARSTAEAGTQWSVLNCFSTYWHPLRWTGSASGVPSPCLETSEPLGTGVDARTVPLCGAGAGGLDRHLKSLRNKRKKHRKSSAKRAREKDRCRKKVNT